MRSSSNTGTFLLSLLFFLYVIFWFILNIFFPPDSPFFNYFTDTYGLIAAVGGFCGYLVSKKWGGLGSIVGRSLALFSAGLFFQFLGQVTYAVYFYFFGIENAYPSIGDFFYFGSIPLYIFAIILLFKVLRLEANLHSIFKRVLSVLIPVFFIVISYLMFLKNYQFSPDAAIAGLLDLGYPLGAAAFLGLTVVAFLFTTSTLGGKLKKNIVLLFVALVTQYFADIVYLIHTMNDTWRAGGLDDLLYLSAYAVMGFTLLSFGKAAEVFLAKSAVQNND